jgi:hypothetical protein
MQTDSLEKNNALCKVGLREAALALPPAVMVGAHSLFKAHGAASGDIRLAVGLRIVSFSPREGVNAGASGLLLAWRIKTTPL